MWPLSSSRSSGPADREHWLVLDVESSGLDALSDRLLALAAVAVRLDDLRIGIDPADSFEAVLRLLADAGPPDKSNILAHGIFDQAAALSRFESFAGTSPRLGFHVEFDRSLIDRATLAIAGHELRNPWLGIADVVDFRALLHLAAQRRCLSWVGRSAACGPRAIRHRRRM